VAIWGTSAENNRAAEVALIAHGRVLVQHCDVAEEAAVERALGETVTALGRVDACFVNAGVGVRSAGQGFVDMTTAEWRRVLGVNLDGDSW
jgi:NAD(P)-dependent dehydrogenase (short-subunit alcohol dehydrogenase family)